MLPAPAPNFTRAILRRTAEIWLMMKLVVTGGALVVQETGIEHPLRAALQLAPFAALALAGLVCGLVLLDAGRRNELIFLANMGVSRAVIAALAAGPVLFAEAILGAAL
jgi:hypothetical protein